VGPVECGTQEGTKQKAGFIMWTCSKCGEQHDDQFESCWKCTQLNPAPESPAPESPGPEPAEGFRRARGSAGFWCAWRRGWLVLAMTLAFGLVATVWTAIFGRSAGFLAVAGLGVAILFLPPCAYWIFVLFFGQEAWPLPGAPKGIPTEERAAALLDEATKLETRGRVQEALAKYQTVVERFPGTAASHDAQKSMESLRANLG
jgi:hypothetical protein